ncbi:MAG: cation:proton antiporter [Alphaproteobacteria bacterium]|nr:cation:proton antiporter [Alphaproteobacteria bacterium]
MSLSVLLFLAIVFMLVFALRIARIGTLVAFLIAGILSGPYIFDLFQLTETWSFLGELGILFLWFNLGLEINMRRLWEMRRTIFGFGITQVMMVAVMLFPILFGITNWSVMVCVMVALMLAMSSTSEDLQLLADRNQVNTDMGRQTFSILLFQDLLSIPLLAMLPVFAGKTFSFGASVIDITVSSAALVVGAAVVGRFVLNPLMRQVSRLKSKEAFLLATMLNIVFWAVMITLIGLPAGLGAFLAGMLMSETIYRHQIVAEISPYATLFLAFFFISLGMGLNLPLLLSRWYMIFAGVIGLVAVKFWAIFIVARVRHVPINDAARIALILSQGGEFGLLMLQTMRTSGIDVLSNSHQEILTATIILSIMVTPLLLAIYDRLQRSGKLLTQAAAQAKNMRGADAPSVVICGFGRVGQIVAKMLTMHNVSYVAIDLGVDSVMMGRERGDNVVYGNCKNADVLREMGLNRNTRAVVVALDNAAESQNVVQIVRSIVPRVKIFARARNLAESRVLVKDGASQALPETIETSFMLGYNVLGILGVDEKQIDETLDLLRANNYTMLDADNAPDK